MIPSKFTRNATLTLQYFEQKLNKGSPKIARKWHKYNKANI